MTTLETLQNLIDADFDVTVRRVKDGYTVECHKWDAGEHESAYGNGQTIDEALMDAWQGVM